MTLTEFLRARIAEDEAAWDALDLEVEQWRHDNADVVHRYWRPNAQRVRAECEAKRRIVARGHSECGGFADQAEFGSHHYPDLQWSFCDGCAAAESADQDWLWTLKALALPFADHADYRPEWAP